jgi:Endonuclease NucS
VDAILISARQGMVEVDDAVRHLAEHTKLSWSVGFPIVTNRLHFPILCFIHVTARQVEYRATIECIIPFDPTHYDDPALKPETWRRDWKASVSEGRAHPFRNELIMTRIDPYSCETTSLRKYGGGLVTNAPQGFIRVLEPDPDAPGDANHESSPSESESYDSLLMRRRRVAERHIEQVILHHLEEIEPGLTLVGRQLTTPVGRLDLLCKDAAGTYVVLEIKRAQGTDRVVGQILRYMGWVIETKGPARGIIIVQSSDPRLSSAIQAATNIQIKEFRMVFE